MLEVPDTVSPYIRPVPDDFQPQFTDDGRRIAWRGNVTFEKDGVREQIAISLGFSKTGPDDLQARLHLMLRIAVWQAKELARIGRADLLANARTDRHSPARRPVAKPQVPPPVDPDANG